jgi:hypothetical protein
MATRPVLRIFISSTATDLADYRSKVRDAVLGLEGAPIAMETFSALPGQPAAECMRLAAEADVVICVVAHRYGYVPPKELGGDGERSMTWLEVEAAQKAGKPVFAFLVDDKAFWMGVKEQDRLTTEPDDKAQEILQAVRKLGEFKTYLNRGLTRGTFTNPDNLATQVAIAVAKLSPAAPIHAGRVWQPLFCHALQPAQHFRGRAARVAELKTWLESTVTPYRVLSLVAAGGTGKTALVDRALHEAKLPDRAGLFVWSFYEDPHTDAFLRAAYVYFTGETNAPTGGMLERLQIALSGDLPHVLVLDGLERVQSEGSTKRRGELEDTQLKRLIKALAGGVGNARALVTSRFPMVDLENWDGAGHKPIVLDDLELDSALHLLRDWKVKGDDATLARLIAPLNIAGTYHALSVAVLGSYVGNFSDGDPATAPQFMLDEPKEGDAKARRLQRILEDYAETLTPAERVDSRSRYEETAKLVAATLDGVETNPRRRLKVFLCHSSGDKPAIRQLYTRLRDDGFSPWLDEENLLAGQDWKDGIAKAVRESHVVLVCLSAGSIAKPGVFQWEIKFAIDVADEKPAGTVFIIPVRLEPLIVPDRLSQLHWVNMFQERGYEKLRVALKMREGSLQ